MLGYHTSVGGPDDCFHFLVIGNMVAMGAADQMSAEQHGESSGISLRVVQFGHVVDLFLVFKGVPILISRVTASLCIPSDND